MIATDADGSLSSIIYAPKSARSGDAAHPRNRPANTAPVPPLGEPESRALYQGSTAPPRHNTGSKSSLHVRGKKPKTSTPAVDAFACNEVRLLIAMLAYQIMHVTRRAMARKTKTPWSLRRLRERVLRAGARLVVSARRMTLILAEAAAPLWAAVWPEIQMLRGASP